MAPPTPSCSRKWPAGNSGAIQRRERYGHYLIGRAASPVSHSHRRPSVLRRPRRLGRLPSNGADELWGSSMDGTTGPNGPCLMNCSNNFGMYSFHSGGCNAVFADGSVHFSFQGMAANVLIALATMQGGETAANNY